YENSEGERVDITKVLNDAIDNTEVITPEEAEALRMQIRQKLAEPQGPEGSGYTQHIKVKNTGSLEAARELYEKNFNNITVLNFASATNPGGGFLKGSQAQEESLSRKSCLYATQISQGERYYRANKKLKSGLYTDHLIYSPSIPVIRDSSNDLLAETWQVNFITSPAVNLGRLKNNEPENIAKVDEYMRRRIEYILAVAVAKETDALVLGAFGCGVFQNDPVKIANIFADFLLPAGIYSQAFSAVDFAILSKNRESENLKAFRKAFSK
ncbi:MAG: TIGR02452 family protein, partial [Halarsenatibacteraceae bacterium]